MSDTSKERWWQWVTDTITELLTFLGEKDFEVYNSGLKVVITLADGDEHWFLYSHLAEPADIAGEVVLWMMKRKEPQP